eukprot:UN00318
MLSWLTGSTKDVTKTEDETKQENNTANDTQIEDEEKKSNNNEKNPKKKNEYPELDLVFLMDCTGSMGSYIAKGKESIMNIVEKVKASEKADVRFCYIAYRDHPPQDKTLVTKVHKFTTKPKDMRKYLSLYQATGGGDGPEAVAEALNDAVNLTYRKNAIKICVIIADAPPHGLGCSGDGFPNGNPNGHDPVKIAKKMAELGIILYVVACEPSLSGFKGAHDLMAGLAQITEGRYLPLTGAHLLPDVIIGGAKEEVSLQKLENFVQNKMDKIKADKPDISVDEMNAKIKTEMNDYGMTHVQNDVEDDAIYGNYNKTNINVWASNASSLSHGRKQQKKLVQPRANFQHQQQQNCYTSAMSTKTVSKMMNRVNKKSKNSYY